MKHTKILTAVAATILILTGCGGSEDHATEPETSQGQDSQNVTTDQDTAEAQGSDEEGLDHFNTETMSDQNGINITGDYKADLRAVGFDPEDHVFHSVIGTLEDSVCEFDSSSISSIAHESMVTAMVQDSNVGPDVVRVIAEYVCPLDAELIDQIILTTTD